MTASLVTDMRALNVTTHWKPAISLPSWTRATGDPRWRAGERWTVRRAETFGGSARPCSVASGKHGDDGELQSEGRTVAPFRATRRNKWRVVGGDRHVNGKGRRSKVRHFSGLLALSGTLWQSAHPVTFEDCDNLRVRRSIRESRLPQLEEPTYYGLNNLDKKIAEYLPEPTGSFVELGAGDGLRHSNTRMFEDRGWRGVLIEPVSSQYEQCVVNRPLAQVFNCACVSSADGETVEMNAVGYMSMVVGAMGGGPREAEWIARGALRNGPAKRIRVPARTLTSVLQEAGLTEIDLLSLDVEGYEVDVLRGLDFSLYAPRWVVAEDAYNYEVCAYLTQNGYYKVTALSELPFVRDLLYRRK
jgi:FkbM family methyltransferase